MKKNITINGTDVELEYMTGVTLSEVTDVRSTNNNLSGAKVKITLDTNFYEVLEWYVSPGDMRLADIRTEFSQYKILPDNTIKFIETHRKGIKPEEFVSFANMVSPFPLMETHAKNAINLMVNWKYGDPKEEYTVHPFDLQTLQFRQPIIFNTTQTSTSGTTTLEVNVTDGSGGYTYSLDDNTYQSPNTFEFTGSTQTYVYVQDTNGVKNSRKININVDTI